LAVKASSSLTCAAQERFGRNRYRFAGRKQANARPAGGTGEGSVLGPIGNIFDGDN
jgi:hypothetical protein